MRGTHWHTNGRPWNIENTKEALTEIVPALTERGQTIANAWRYGGGELAALEEQLRSDEDITSALCALAHTLDSHGLLDATPPMTWRRRWAHRIVRRQREKG